MSTEANTTAGPKPADLPPHLTEAASEILQWYDKTARVLPWRSQPGQPAPSAYRVWLSEIMLQQTVVATVKPYFARFTALWPDVHALAAAPREAVLAEWAGLGYYARARNLHKCAQAVAGDLAGSFPDTEEGLRALPGIGPYTAGAIAAIAFGRRAAAIDGNVERVMSRLCAIETPLPESRKAIRPLVEPMIPADRPGDFAQALMDLGATICIPKAPRCPSCPWRARCAGHSRGIAPDLPRKAPRKPKPHRHSVVFAHFNERGELLMETRPDKGLLGGMTGLPGPEWTKAPPDEATIMAAAPGPGPWLLAGPRASHVFTHFQLELQVKVASGPALPGHYVPVEKARADAPTVMRKAIDIAVDALRPAN